MPCGIPLDFSFPWPHSDVVVLAADDKELYGNEAVLGDASSFFHDLFFDNVRQNRDDGRVNLYCDYELLKEIFFIVHHKNCEHISTMKIYDWDMLIAVYEAAEMMSIPLVKKICAKQLCDHGTIDAGIRAIHWDQHEVLMHILRPMTRSNRRKVCRASEDSPKKIFSKMDFLYILGWENLQPRGRCIHFTREDLVRYTTREPSLLQSTPVTMRTITSDVEIWLRDGKPLYSNKELLSSHSEFFKRIFAEQPHITVLNLDEDYVIMKEILSIIHNTYPYSNAQQARIHPIVAYLLYIRSTKDQMDIPLVRSVCVDNLLKTHLWTSLEILMKLGLDEEVHAMIPRLPTDFLTDWLLVKNNSLSYELDKHRVFIATDPTQKLLTTEHFHRFSYKMPPKTNRQM